VKKLGLSSKSIVTSGLVKSYFTQKLLSCLFRKFVINCSIHMDYFKISLLTFWRVKVVA